MNNTQLPRMRTPGAAFEEIKVHDPDTELTVKALRRLVRAGDIPSVKVGRKYLINMETLYKYLYNGIAEPEKKTDIRATI